MSCIFFVQLDPHRDHATWGGTRQFFSSLDQDIHVSVIGLPDCSLYHFFYQTALNKILIQWLFAIEYFALCFTFYDCNRTILFMSFKMNELGVANLPSFMLQETAWRKLLMLTSITKASSWHLCLTFWGPKRNQLKKPWGNTPYQ